MYNKERADFRTRMEREDGAEPKGGSEPEGGDAGDRFRRGTPKEHAGKSHGTGSRERSRCA